MLYVSVTLYIKVSAKNYFTIKATVCMCY